MWLGITGLAVNAVGTVLVFVFGVPSRVQLNCHVMLSIGQDETNLKREKLSAAIGWAGLAMILVGAALQGAALLME